MSAPTMNRPNVTLHQTLNGLADLERQIQKLREGLLDAVSEGLLDVTDEWRDVSEKINLNAWCDPHSLNLEIHKIASLARDVAATRYGE